MTKCKKWLQTILPILFLLLSLLPIKETFANSKTIQSMTKSSKREN